MILFRCYLKPMGGAHHSSYIFVHTTIYFFCGVYLMEIYILTTYFSLLYFHKSVKERRKVVLFIT